MGLTFEQVVTRENFLKEDFPKINKHKRYVSRFYYELGNDWSKLGNFKKAKEYLWQAFLSWPLRIGCLFKIIGITIKASPYRYSVLKRNSELNKVIKNQRVLIIGSGPSANELKYIPRDVKILTCNIGPRLLLEKEINREIDLYYCARGVLGKGHKNESVIDLFSKLKINLFIIYNTKLIKKHYNLKKTYAKCIKDKGFNDYYLNKLIEPQKREEIKSPFLNNNRTSAGVRLLQYALYFKAKEIYLIGIDINEEGYFWGRNNIHEHLCIDKNFIEIVSKKYNNVYSASENSPIVRYVKYKPLK